jgi:hypothetical protein
MWHDVEGQPFRKHKAVAHSYNSINKHVGCVRVRSVEVLEDGEAGALMHSLFGEEDDAWVFEERADGQMVYMARLDEADISFTEAYAGLGASEFADAHDELCGEMEAALWGYSKRQ